MDDLLTLIVQYAPAVAIIAYLVYALMRTVERMVQSMLEAQMQIVATLERIMRDCVNDESS
jgi:hypothetical protein